MTIVIRDPNLSALHCGCRRFIHAKPNAGLVVANSDANSNAEDPPFPRLILVAGGDGADACKCE